MALKVRTRPGSFRLRGLQKVGIVFTLAAIGFNLTGLRAEQDQDSPLWARRRKREREKARGFIASKLLRPLNKSTHELQKPRIRRHLS